MTTKKKLLAVDFFCCAGGVTHGFKKAGINVVAGIDIEAAYRKSYESNNPGAKFIQADISELQPVDLRKRLKIKPGMDNLIFVGCSPCQYYTIMQTDKTKSAKGKLLLEEFKRFVDYFRPGYIFLENVPGLSRKGESPLENFKNYLRQIGYVFAEDIVNAADYEVPQNRLRYVLIASRVNKGVKIPQGSRKRVTVRSALGGLPVIPAGYRDTNTQQIHWSARLSPLNLQRLQNTPHNGGTRAAWKDDVNLQLACYVGKDDTFPDVYGRMKWDAPGPTITTKFYSISNGRFGHPEQDRALSLREGAALQSFPHRYRFFGTSQHVIARMIGNAVPPEMAKWIGINIRKLYSRAAI